MANVPLHAVLARQRFPDAILTELACTAAEITALYSSRTIATTPPD